MKFFIYPLLIFTFWHSTRITASHEENPFNQDPNQPIQNINRQTPNPFLLDSESLKHLELAGRSFYLNQKQPSLFHMINNRHQPEDSLQTKTQNTFSRFDELQKQQKEPILTISELQNALKKEQEKSQRLENELKQKQEEQEKFHKEQIELRIQKKAKNLQEMYKNMEESELNDYKRTLRLIGFDLTTFQDLLSVIQGTKYISTEELHDQMKKMQKKLQNDLTEIPFSKKDFNFLQENNETIIWHTKKLNDLLKEILASNLLEENQKIDPTSSKILTKEIASTSSEILTKAIASIQTIKNIPVEKLIEEKSEYAFIATIANTATAVLPILVMAWSNREELQKIPSLLKKKDIATTYSILNNTFKLTNMALSYIQDQAISYGQEMLTFLEKKEYKIPKK